MLFVYMFKGQQSESQDPIPFGCVHLPTNRNEGEGMESTKERKKKKKEKL